MQCPTRCLLIRNGKRVYVSSENCSQCGHCFAICPVGAISIFGITADQAEVDLNDLKNIFNIVRYRRSIRKYDPTPLPRETIVDLINFTKYAPSALNSRPVKYLVINRSCMDEVGQMVAEEMVAQYPKLPAQQAQLDIVFRGAPHCIVAYIPVDLIEQCQDDADIALTQLDLLAQARGLGSFWAGMLKMQGNKSERIRKRIGLPENTLIGCCLGIGRPAIRYKRSVGREPYHVDFVE